MNRTLLSKRISSLLAEVSRLSNALCAMNTMDLQRYPENYELLSTDAALRAEQIACRMRHLVYGFTTVQKHEYLTSAANVLGITITAQPGLVEITLPGLLPKKKQRSAEYLTDPLEQALGQFVKDHPLSHFESCIICFCHIYAVSGGRGRIRCDVTRSVSKMTEIERRGGKRWDKPKKAGKSRDCRGGKF